MRGVLAPMLANMQVVELQTELKHKSFELSHFKVVVGEKDTLLGRTNMQASEAVRQEGSKARALLPLHACRLDGTALPCKPETAISPVGFVGKAMLERLNAASAVSTHVPACPGPCPGLVRPPAGGAAAGQAVGADGQVPHAGGGPQLTCVCLGAGPERSCALHCTAASSTQHRRACRSQPLRQPPQAQGLSR